MLSFRPWAVFNGLKLISFLNVFPSVLRNGQPVDDDIDIIPLKVNQEKQLPFDATDAGPGTTSL